MPLTSAQIISLSCQAEGVPGWTQQAGQLLNSVLSDLCQSYDFDLARVALNFNFNPGLITPIGNLNVVAGNGPYALPANYLRTKPDNVRWFLNGVPYDLVPIDLEDFDSQVEQAGLQSLPFLWATDTSQSPPVAYVWPPASGAFPVLVRYFCQMPDIGSGLAAVNGFNPGTTAPESSSVVPWFPNSGYLLKELKARLRDLKPDADSADGLHGEADRMLSKYLVLKDDSTNRAKRITLDPRRFGKQWKRLPNTKNIGWAVLLSLFLPHAHDLVQGIVGC